MRFPDQVEQLDGMADYIGFIFFEQSKRFIEKTSSVTKAQKVGVFVNASLEEIELAIRKHSLDIVQLHGNEVPELCTALKPSVQLMKAFGVNSSFEFNTCAPYEGEVDYFLFDTKTPLHGGSGKQFDWSILTHYKGNTPFLLGGGIAPHSVESLKAFQHPKFAGIDLNSGFEHSPGDKNIAALTTFIEQIKN